MSAASQCLKITKSGKQCSRAAECEGYCWQHQNEIKSNLSADTELLALGYLPIEESLSVLEDKPELQKELVRIYYQTPSDYNYLVLIDRPDLVSELLGKHIGNVLDLDFQKLETLAQAFHDFKGLDSLHVEWWANTNPNPKDLVWFLDRIMPKLDSLSISESTPDFTLWPVTLLETNIMPIRELSISGKFSQNIIDTLAYNLQRNTHLTKLSLSSSRDKYDINKIAKALINNPNVTDLRLTCSYVYVYPLTDISNLVSLNKTLTRLYLDSVHITSGSVIEFSAALKLNTTLKAFKITIENQSLEATQSFTDALKANKSIEELSIKIILPNRNPIYEIWFFQSFGTQLTYLDLSGTNLTDLGIEILAGRLQNKPLLLELGNALPAEFRTDRKDEVTVETVPFTNLQTLKIYAAETTLEGNLYFVDSLRTNTTLTELVFKPEDMDLTDEILNAWTQVINMNKTLKSLDINGFGSSLIDPINVFEALQNNTSLTYLDLGFIDLFFIGDFSNVIKYNRALTSIDLSENHINDRYAEPILEALNYNTTLKKIDLTRNPFSEKLDAELKLNPRIELSTRRKIH